MLYDDALHCYMMIPWKQCCVMIPCVLLARALCPPLVLACVLVVVGTCKVH